MHNLWLNTFPTTNCEIAEETDTFLPSYSLCSLTYAPYTISVLFIIHSVPVLVLVSENMLSIVLGLFLIFTHFPSSTSFHFKQTQFWVFIVNVQNPGSWGESEARQKELSFIPTVWSCGIIIFRNEIILVTYNNLPFFFFCSIR